MGGEEWTRGKGGNRGSGETRMEQDGAGEANEAEKKEGGEGRRVVVQVVVVVVRKHLQSQTRTDGPHLE